MKMKLKVCEGCRYRIMHKVNFTDRNRISLCILKFPAYVLRRRNAPPDGCIRMLEHAMAMTGEI